MALEKTVITEQGFIAENAYHKVSEVKISGKVLLDYLVTSHKTRDSQPFNGKQFSCGYSLDGDNPIAQAYAHLRTIPEFAEAVDC